MFSKILSLVLKHKLLTGIILVVIIGGGYFGFQKFTSQGSAINYITATVGRGTLITSIFGTGQVSSSNQVDIKPKVSGDIVAVNFKSGSEIKEGELLAQIDSRDVARKVSEAQASLESAQLELEELLAPVDAYTLLQAENDLANAQDDLTQLISDQEREYQDTLKGIEEAEDNLEKAYEDAYNAVADAFLDLPDIISGLDNILYSYEISNSVVSLSLTMNKSALINSLPSSATSNDRGQMQVYINNAEDDYSEVYNAYSEAFDDYTDASRYSEDEVIEELLEQTLETTKLISDTVKSESNMLDFWVVRRTFQNLTIFSQVTAYQSDLSTYTSQTNSHLSTLLAKQISIESYKNQIQDAQEDLAEMEQSHPLEIAQAERGIAEKEEKLKDLLAGADQLDIKNKEITVQQKRNSLIEAQQNLANYYIRAPFDGMVASIEITKGDYISSNSTIASLITTQKIAEVTLNEIDVAQVEVGQKATLEFDAVEDLSITGQVVEVDILGEVTQGVVSYGVKVAFDVQDERIKPGMSVSTSIIIESKQNVLLVPVSAVKTMGEITYVETLINNQPSQQIVTTSSSNDIMIEIIEGLEEGDQVITQTINNNSQNQSLQTGAPGGNDPMRAMRFMR